jgi:hypothetical protein
MRHNMYSISLDHDIELDIERVLMTLLEKQEISRSRRPTILAKMPTAA